MNEIIRFRFFLSIVFVVCGIFINAQDLDFRRRHTVGNIYDAKIVAKQDITCELKGINGETKTLEKSKVFEFEGVLKILACDDSGAVTEILFSSERIFGSIDGNNSYFQNVFKEFKIKWEGETPKVNNLREDLSTSLEEMELLLIAFRSPSSQGKLDDILGEKREYKDGEIWSPSNQYLKRIFSSRGLLVEDRHISNKAFFVGKVKMDEIDCAMLKSEIKLSGIDDFSFDYSAEIILPFESSLLPLNTKSKSVEKILIRKIKQKPSDPMQMEFSEMRTTITNLLNVSLRSQRKTQ